MKHKIKSAFLVLILLISTTTCVKAEELDLNKTGSISIVLNELETKEPIIEAELAIYYIASVKELASGLLEYTYVDELANCGVSIMDSELVTKLDSLVSEMEYTYTFITDHQGKAHISNLPLGLYYVKQINSVEGYAPCKSFIVTMPMKENASYIYDVNASPKTEVEKLISITIKKEWEADENATIPNEVTIQLYNEDTLVKTAVLNERNNWQISYENMPKSDAYVVKETNIADGFTPIYEEYNYIFTVTNVSSLVDTGQLFWPIPVLGFAGIMFITMGFLIIRKTGNSNE